MKMDLGYNKFGDNLMFHLKARYMTDHWISQYDLFYNEADLQRLLKSKSGNTCIGYITYKTGADTTSGVPCA